MSHWYDGLTHLDAPAAIKKSGSEDFYKRALKLFQESSAERRSELTDLFEAEDWHGYTIKIHALKSVARIIGAMSLGDEAEALEMAGKRGDTEYIKTNNDKVVAMYDEVCAQVNGVLANADKDGNCELSPADGTAMEDFFRAMKKAAEDMDLGRIGDLFDDMEGLAIPDNDKELFDTIRSCFDIIDYDGIVSALRDRV
ncbi:MAG: Hpt domain-containing protein [Lachnospiraceae bacterium]|nr:Hpt domain-containing protein [Lachnospiraceae bacterium]